jgi:general secretion pathway protein H
MKNSDLQKGFSLFEMLVVMVIMGVIAAMATPAVGRIMDTLSFRGQTRKITSLIRYARLQSISSGEEILLTLDEGDECVFRISGLVEETRGCGLAEDDVLVMEPGEIMFFPEGTATPAMITFEKGERIRKIRVDLLTAMPITQS